MDKRQLKNEIFNFLGKFGINIKTKFSNICGKTGRYNVPNELFQKRTPRKNRALISWKAVKENDLTIEKLNTFEGGVVVEFSNNDYFDENNFENETFNELLKRIGSDDNVSAIISFRSEAGSSSSAVPREAFRKFLNNTKVLYKGQEIYINADNYKDYIIKQVGTGGSGNEKWDGFLFVSIKGGQQDTIETHRGVELTIFNPACEYANEDICLDIDLVLGYFALRSIAFNSLTEDDKVEYQKIIDKVENELSTIYYEIDNYHDTLLNYCVNHVSLKVRDGELTDPIQLKQITLENFDISNNSPESIDLTHDEAVNKEKYYWDEDKNCVLGPARPTNLFWSYHLSNMMQQDFNLKEYFEYEQEIHNLREELMNK